MPKLVHITTAPESLCFLSGRPHYLEEHGFEVTIICSPSEALERFGRDEGVDVIGIPMSRAITPVSDALAVGALVRTLRRIEPDIVHAGTPKAGLLGMIAARVAGVPARVYQIHGLPLMTATGAMRALLTTTERIAAALANHVLSVSHGIREVALAEGIGTGRGIDVLHNGSANGVDVDGKFDPGAWSEPERAAAREALGVADHHVLVTFLGRVTRDKGVADLTTAWVRVAEAHPHARLLVAGPFETRDGLAPQVCEALTAGAPSVIVSGRRIDDVAPLYAATDVLVLPTYREGLPTVVLEAQSMARPVVTTRVPGCLEACIDGETALLVPAGEVEALADAICRYVASETLRTEHGAAGREFVSRAFRREAVWEATLQLYARLMDGTPRGAEAVS